MFPFPGCSGCLCLCCPQPRCPCAHLSSEPLNLPNFLSLLLCPTEEESTEQTSQVRGCCPSLEGPLAQEGGRALWV